MSTGASRFTFDDNLSRPLVELIGASDWVHVSDTSLGGRIIPIFLKFS